MKTDWTIIWGRNYSNLEWKSWIWRLTRAYKNLLKNIDLKNPKILELGSGSGINSLKMAKIFKGGEITLVDSNKKALEISKRSFKGSNFKVKYLNKNVLNLNLKEEFDIVHSEGLVEHFYGKNRIRIFKKHTDFCKKSGFIIIFVPYKGISYSLFKFFYRVFNKWVWDEKIFSKEELYQLCRKFNLKILKKYTSPLIHEIGILLKKGGD